ncbi:unnamed protein product [Closterium sp. NIES-65]|nr:unnamed protein product [Closterium sp. NIES-65]
MLSPTSRRLLSRDGGGFSDSEMEAMHDSMWRWRNSMDRSRRRGGMMGGRGGGGMMGGRGKAVKESAEKEAFPEGDCGGNGGGEKQEAPHLELIRRSMRAEHAMTDVPGMDEMMGDRDGMMMEADDMMEEGDMMMNQADMMMQGESIATGNGKVMMPHGDGMVGRQVDDKEMEDMMEGMMGGNRMMLRGGNA